MAELRASREPLWAEFIGLFVAVPVATAVLLPPRAMFPVLFAFTLVGLWLLSPTPGLRRGALKRGREAVNWPVVLGFAALTLAVSVAIVWLTAPGVAFRLRRQRAAAVLI